MRNRLLVVILALALVLIPAVVLAGGGQIVVHGTEYVPDESGTIFIQVLDEDGVPVNDATVVLTMWDTDGNKELDGVSATYIAASNGIYHYDFTAPSDDGVYVVDVTTSSPTGYGSTEIHVSSEGGGGGASASDIWEEEIAGYTDTTTFGGVINTTLGGDIMLLVLLGFMALVFLVVFFWKKAQMAAYGAAGVWTLFGIQAMQQSTSPNPAQIQDVYMGLFWLGIVFTIACIFLPLVMREKPSPDDLYMDEIDEVTGEPKEKDEPKKKRRPFLSRFSKTGKE